MRQRAAAVFWSVVVLAVLIVLSWILTPEVHGDPDRFVDSPGGRLTLIRSEHPAREALTVLGRGHAQAFWLILDSPSHAWFRFAAAWDSTVRWPRDRTLVVTLRDGRELEASFIMVTGHPPTMVPVMLGLVDRWLEPDQLSVRRWRNRAATVLFVAFPDPRVGLGDIAGVQVRQRSRVAAPAR